MKISFSNTGSAGNEISTNNFAFSKWTTLSDLLDKKKNELAVNVTGIYLIAEFKNNPPSECTNLDKRILYIGETCGKNRSLKQRISEFNRCAESDVGGHSGGNTFRAQKSEKGWNLKNLYVSVLPIPYSNRDKKNEGVKSSAEIRYVERVCLYKYFSEYGKLPDCNSK